MAYARLQVQCGVDYVEILIAELAEAGFGMFMENEEGFEADAEESDVDQVQLTAIREKYSHVKPLSFVLSSVEKQNWNEEWEKNVTPVMIGDQAIIKAEFHKVSTSFPYEIIITPKMSFGTGHHQTTYLMVKSQLTIDHTDKRVMDAGCGTAVLSIMASKRGARVVEAFDIDEWSILNGQENAVLNQCTNIRIRQGTIANFQWAEPFDIILANINRNILLNEMESYSRHLLPHGLLQLSGFYISDIPDLVDEAKKYGLRPLNHEERDQWATLRLEKSS